MDSVKLIPSALEMLKASKAERIAYIARPKWISYRVADEAFAKMRSLVEQDRSEGSRIKNLILYGDAANGKSFLLRTFKRVLINENIEAEKDLSEGEKTVPVVMADFPVVPDERRMYSQILKAAHIPHSTKDTPQNLLNQIVSIFHDIEVKLLILDEFHNLLTGPSRQQRRALVALKNLSNELRLPIVLSGTVEAKIAIHVDPQFVTRFDGMPLTRWTDGKRIGSFLRNYEKVIPLHGGANLTDVVVKSRIVARSRGLIGQMTSLVQAAAIESINNGNETITPELIDSIPENDFDGGASESISKV
ncbi:TniB family NTP-binding protein [Coraliomargarita sp. SDUM461003]|uniref:TniB family NTP-binding protein n=1 Tax=Thalassobacterium maritimum TaxID=3041265 RepID=A0ABU1AP10_9BACT|nr:TniB family NTP-binding protein [Coraliomargarita sp. SDUM461003]MDQ8205904.1 TniB family NTP-binding protein [Coraliomargarita sp. SDUM461003]